MAEAITIEDVAMAGSTYGADYDLAGATLRQCADEIHVALRAMDSGCADSLVQTALMGIAQRMEIAAAVTVVELTEPATLAAKLRCYADDIENEGRSCAPCVMREAAAALELGTLRRQTNAVRIDVASALTEGEAANG